MRDDRPGANPHGSGHCEYGAYPKAGSARPALRFGGLGLRFLLPMAQGTAVIWPEETS